MGEADNPAPMPPFLRHLNMPTHRLNPSLDGSPLEVCLALLTEDLSPEEAAGRVAMIGANTKDSTRELLADAQSLYEEAARFTQAEELGLSLEMIGAAKDLVRAVALEWLAPRQCQCCIEARNQLAKEEGSQNAS